MTSVGNMCAVAGIKANTSADTGNSPNVVSILGQHLNSWHRDALTSKRRTHIGIGYRSKDTESIGGAYALFIDIGHNNKTQIGPTI